MWDVGSGQQGLGGAQPGQPAVAFNVTPARYGVSKPVRPTFLSCGCLACCRSKKKICCPAEDRFVIVNCQWRSSEGALPERGDGRRRLTGARAAAATGCCLVAAAWLLLLLATGVRGQGRGSWEHPDDNRSGNRGCSCFPCTSR